MKKGLLFLLLLVKMLDGKKVEGYGYDFKFNNISKLSNISTAIAIVTYNRPDYLKQVVEALEINPESQTLPFYFFLDGGSKATQKENLDIIQASKLRYKEIIARHRNFGCPKNLIDARRFLFDWCKYNKVIVLEDDIVVSPNFIGLALRLHTWARKKYVNVGMVDCWSYCFLDTGQKRDNLCSVKESSPWWAFHTYCLDKKVWDDIKDIFFVYENFIDEIPEDESFNRARSKPQLWIKFPEMVAWLSKMLNSENPRELIGLKFPYAQSTSYLKEIFLSNRPYTLLFDMNQDMMNAFALWKAGYIKIQTVVNRAINIGRLGGITPGAFHALRYDQMSLDSFIEDETMSEFKPVESPILRVALRGHGMWIDRGKLLNLYE